MFISFERRALCGFFWEVVTLYDNVEDISSAGVSSKTQSHTSKTQSVCIESNRQTSGRHLSLFEKGRQDTINTRQAPGGQTEYESLNK